MCVHASMPVYVCARMHVHVCLFGIGSLLLSFSTLLFGVTEPRTHRLASTTTQRTSGILPLLTCTGIFASVPSFYMIIGNPKSGLMFEKQTLYPLRHLPCPYKFRSVFNSVRNLLGKMWFVFEDLEKMVTHSKPLSKTTHFLSPVKF